MGSGLDWEALAVVNDGIYKYNKSNKPVATSAAQTI